MRAKLLAVPLLVGAGFLVGLFASSPIAHAGQKGKGGGGKAPVNRPAQRPNNQPKAHTPPAAQRPAPRPSAPTLSRPSAPAQPKQQPRPQQPANRPSIGDRPAMGTTPPQARPTTPRPGLPTTRPAQLAAPKIDRPATLPGLGGSVGNRPKVDPTPLPGRPPINSNQRPSVLPGRPDTPATRPGLPNLPADRPVARPPIGERPNLPDRPDRPPVTWPSRPDQRPTPLPAPVPKDIKPKLPDPKGKLPDPKRPDGKWPDRPGVVWPDRPRPDRPGGNVNINRPTVVNRPTNNTVINNNVNRNRTTVNNINQRNNYYSNNTNVYAGGNAWAVQRINDYHGAWYNNFSYWHQSYHPWYNGCWHGNAFDHWGLGVANVGVGFGLWGLNSLNYMFGYTSYVNPFYVAPPPTVVVPQYLTYTQPVVNVVQALPETGREPPPMPPSAAETFDAALAEFKKGNYRAALEKTEQAMKQFPDDPVMHEFRALCLFALGDYRQASAAVHALLASGPGWDWTTLSSLYPDTDTYSGQLSALEKRAATNPDDSAALFLLAYHYTTIGQADAARDVLDRLHKLLPTDSVVTQLWQAAGGTVATSTTPPKEPPPPPDINLDIVGNWVATRPDGGRIGLGVKNDGTFTWSVEDKAGKKDAFDGTFTLEDNVMVLERKAGGALMGRVTALSDTSFNFKAIGGGDADPGLVFKK